MLYSVISRWSIFTRARNTQGCCCCCRRSRCHHRSCRKKRPCSYRLNLLIEMRQVSQVSSELIFGVLWFTKYGLFGCSLRLARTRNSKSDVGCDRLLMRNARTMRWFTMSFCYETQSTSPSNAVVLNVKSVTAVDPKEGGDGFFPPCNFHP
jgi:hypothetical protein